MRSAACRLPRAPHPHRIVSTATRIEVIVSSTTDVSTAGTDRIAGASASGLFMLTRHGCDVVLPRFAETDIMFIFDRVVSLSAAQPVPVARGNRDQTRLSMMDQ